MLRRMKEIRNFAIKAEDGEIGTVDEFYFDDSTWRIRYLVVNVGKFLMRKDVLIAPDAIRDVGASSIEIGMSRDQIKNSPDIDTAQPVSLQHQKRLHDYYGWPYYWSVDGPVSGVFPPFYTTNDFYGSDFRYVNETSENDQEAKPADAHLRSSREVTGYHIQATDGEIGHLDDFVVDDKCTKILYLMVATKNWLPGRKVIVSPKWIHTIADVESKIMCDVDRAKIEASPDFNPEMSVDHEYETMAH